MGRKPCVALLLCFCSCSLDTTPDIESASQPDASMSSASPHKWQQASLRFDAPLQPRTQSALKRAAHDDTDAGHEPSHESRDAGRTASDRPAQASSRDAGAMDAGAKQKSKSTGDARGDVKDAASQSPDSSHPKSPSSASEQAPAQEHDAGDSRSSRSAEEKPRRHHGEEEQARDDERSDGNDDDEYKGRRDRGSDNKHGHKHGR